MKKMKLVKMFVAAVSMALFFVGCNDSNSANKKEEQIKVTALDYTQKNDFADYNIKLPQIEDVDNEDVNYLNLTMQESLRYIVENMSREAGDGLIKTADISYKEHANKFGVLSLTVDASLSNGGAHPENVLDTYNINKKDAKLLTFGKVFTQDDINYFNMLINDQIKAGKKAVKNTQGKEAHLFSEVEADVRNAVFYFEGDSLVFVFQQYMLGPYSSGMPVFKFNKSEIKGHLQLNK